MYLAHFGYASQMGVLPQLLAHGFLFTVSSEHTQNQHFPKLW